MKFILNKITYIQPLIFALSFLVIFSVIVFYVDYNLSKEKQITKMNDLSNKIERYIYDELTERVINSLIMDSLVKYRFLDTTTTINILGINPTDSTALFKELLVGYMKVRYSDDAVDTGYIDTAKIYIGEKQGIPYQLQTNKNPNGITMYPHYLI